MFCIRKVEKRKMMALKEEDIRSAALFAKYLEMTVNDAADYFANAGKTGCGMSGMW